MTTAPVVGGLFAGALLLAAAYWIGYDHGADRYRDLVAQHAAQTEEALAQAERAAELLDGAMQALGLTEKRVVEVLRKKTTGRACLDDPVRRLLNDLATDMRKGTDLPIGEGSWPATGDPGLVATDNDVAQWAASVITRYEGCRAQLAAIRAATDISSRRRE